MAAWPYVEQMVAGAAPCPHPELLERAKVVVSDGSSQMALCSLCYRVMRHLVARAEDGDKPDVLEVTSELVALGYDPTDAQRFWEDLP